MVLVLCPYCRSNKTLALKVGHPTKTKMKCFDCRRVFFVNKNTKQLI